VNINTLKYKIHYQPQKFVVLHWISPLSLLIQFHTILKGAPKKRNEIRDREHRYQGTRMDNGNGMDVPVPTWNPGVP